MSPEESARRIESYERKRERDRLAGLWYARSPRLPVYSAPGDPTARKAATLAADCERIREKDAAGKTLTPIEYAIARVLMQPATSGGVA
jgi:hypothetical protein